MVYVCEAIQLTTSITRADSKEHPMHNRELQEVLNKANENVLDCC